MSTDLTSIAQAYDLGTADAQAAQVARRRVTNYLGLRIEDIALGRRLRNDELLSQNELAAVIELRIDSDFGDYLCSIGRLTASSALTCLDRAAGGVRTDPELGNHRPELLFAYIEGRRLGGWLTLRLGRQLTWDLLDLRGLDGLQISAQTPLYLAIDAWGGLSQNGGLAIDPSLYVLDGTSRRPALSATRAFDDRGQQWLAPQPTLGVSARLTGVPDLQVRISYRHTFSPTAQTQAAGCAPGQGCAPAWGSIEDRLAGSAHGRLLDGRLQGFAALRYDLLSGRLDEAQASLRGVLAGSAAATGRGQHTLSADYRYDVPTWDGDSIWNVFASDPYHHAGLRYHGRRALSTSARASSRAVRSELTWTLGGYSRLFFDTARATAPLAEAVSVQSLHPAAGGDASLLYRRGSSHLRLDGFYGGGYGGTQAGGDVAGRWALLRDTVSIESRVLYTYYADELRDSSRSHGLALQLGVRWAFIRGALLHVFVEDSVDRYSSSQVRLLASLDLSALLGPHGGPQSVTGLLPAGFGAAPSAQPLPGLLF